MCRFVFYAFCFLYLIAILLWLAGTFGWFGIEKDAMSAVFLVMLGQPWERWVSNVLPENLWPIGAAVAPAINAAIVFAICRLLAMR